LAPWDAQPGELRAHASFLPWPADEYRAVRELAQAPANSGAVYECVHLPSGAHYVVKVMPNTRVMMGARTEDAKVDIAVSSFLARNRNTFVDLGRHLAASSSAYQDEHNTYFVTEFYAGGDLFSHVSRERFDEPRARKYARQVIEGVASLHACGIAHRDISLENLVLGADDDVRIIDFGLAVPIASASYANALYSGAVGKKHYRAPEMEKGPYESQPVDAWAVGVAIYIMVAGTPPWIVAESADKNFRYFLRHGLERYIVALGMGDLFSRELLDLLKSLLAENPHDRITLEDALMHPWFQV
jgi:serine/threonine protein kinase